MDTGVGSHTLFQGIFPTQGMNPDWATREVQEHWDGSLSLSQGIFWIQESNQGLLNCRWILYQLNDPESPKGRLWPHGSGIELQPPAWQMRIPPLNHPRGLAKESACQAGDTGLILRSGKSPGEGNGNPLQCSCLGNHIDRGNWRATVNGVTKESNITLLVSN